MAAEFSRDIEMASTRLEAAVEAGDHLGVADAAHHLNGSAHFVGATSLAGRAGAVDRAARAGSLPDRAGLERLRSEADAAVEALRGT